MPIFNNQNFDLNLLDQLTNVVLSVQIASFHTYSSEYLLQLHQQNELKTSSIIENTQFELNSSVKNAGQSLNNETTNIAKLSVSVFS
jgi:hypothetical protein